MRQNKKNCQLYISLSARCAENPKKDNSDRARTKNETYLNESTNAVGDTLLQVISSLLFSDTSHLNSALILNLLLNHRHPRLHPHSIYYDQYALSLPSATGIKPASYPSGYRLLGHQSKGSGSVRTCQ